MPKEYKTSQEDRDRGAAWKRQLRLTVLTVYSPELKCACCGSMDYDSLELDHIDGKGEAHRQKVWGRHNVSSDSMYGWARRNGYPKIFQVLCSGCNWDKADTNKCPCNGTRNNDETI